MPLPVDTVLTAGTRLLVGNLGPNRTLPSYTIRTAAAAAAATSVSLSVASGTLFLQGGTELNFGGAQKTVVLLDDVTLTSTAASVPIVSPLGAALVATDTAPTNALLQVYGGNDASLSLKDNEAPTRAFESGLFDDAKKVMVGGSISWKGTYRRGDKSLDLIEACAIGANEIYIRLVYPDGKSRTGVAFVQGYQESNTLDAVREVSWEFRLVGEFKFNNPV